MEVTVGGRKIIVPVYRDKETTRRIAHDLNQRLNVIEKGSKRIDTQVFALEAAFALATELAKAEQTKTSDNSEMLVALDQLRESLESLLEDHRPES